MSIVPRTASTSSIQFTLGLLLGIFLPFAASAMEEFEKKTVTITEADMNKEVKIKKGELLAVKLKSQPGTGYGWKLTDKWELVHLKTMGEPTLEEGTGLDGGIECQVFRFNAESTGKEKLELQYKRSFGENQNPRKKFNVSVVVESR